MTTVTAAEFQKNFGQYREKAQREPVSITSYGRESVVLISAETYQRYQALDARRAFLASDLPEDMIQALEREVSTSDTKASDLPEISF